MKKVEIKSSEGFLQGFEPNEQYAKQARGIQTSPLPEWLGDGCNQKPDLVPKRNVDLLAEDVNFVWRAKQGLRNCSYGTDGDRDCFACPYWQSRCEQDLHKDSLGAILYLEQRNRDLAGMAGSAMREKVQLHETIDQLKVQLEAALGELKRAAGENAVCIGCSLSR